MLTGTAARAIVGGLERGRDPGRRERGNGGGRPVRPSRVSESPAKVEKVAKVESRPKVESRWSLFCESRKSGKSGKSPKSIVAKVGRVD